MAQLSDDCFAFGGPLMSVDDAVAIITSRVNAISETELVAIGDADGRVLAFDMIAPMSLPPFTNSAVDGYAVRSVDIPSDGEVALPIEARIQAGSFTAEPIEAGKAARIFTGAPMPPSTDTVFMQEDVRIDDAGRVVVPAGLKVGANVRPAGEDVARGQVALRKGQQLRPQDIALIAALGITEIQVRRRLRVVVFSTGNEVVSPGGARGEAQLFDSNRYMLASMLRGLGCKVSDLGILRDDRATLARALKQAAGQCDLILTSGGVSTGEEDHVKASVESVGTLVLWRMAIKPGRPVAMGVIDGTPFIGLPGNPVASFVTFTYVVRPTALALMGAAHEPFIPIAVRAAFTYRKKSGRREYVRASLRRTADGLIEAVKFPREGAGMLSSLTETDGLVELAEHITDVEPGQTVGFLGYGSLR